MPNQEWTLGKLTAINRLLATLVVWNTTDPHLKTWLINLLTLPKPSPGNFVSFDGENGVLAWLTANAKVPVAQSGRLSRFRHRARTAEVSFTVEYSEREYGSCGYAQTNYGQARLDLDIGELQTLIDDDGELDEAALDDLIQEEIGENGEIVDSGDCEYENHEANDSEFYGMEDSTVQAARDAVLDYIADHPELFGDEDE